MRAEKTEYIRKKKVLCLLFGLAAVFLLYAFLYQEWRKYSIHGRLTESEAFRSMQVKTELLEGILELESVSGLGKGRLLTLAFAKGKVGFSQKAPSWKEMEGTAKWLYRYRSQQYEALEKGFCAVWDDLVCFPVKTAVSYEDSWMAERNYGGKRGHEGTDLIPSLNQPDLYPVFSVTSGTIEHMGWLPKGGWRIGIRSRNGGYFYYAHLSSFAEGLSEGKEVEAGTMLGYMGDSGYGEEGTTGQFPVHLHFGIYIQTGEGKEISVNPYWVLKSMEEKQKTDPREA